MNWDLAKTVVVEGKKYKIRRECDYRIVLDVIAALNDNELRKEERWRCALFIFYEDLSACGNLQCAAEKMLKIINLGEDEKAEKVEKSKKLMDWEYDFNNIASPISRVLGYSVRDERNYTHWYDFIGAYGEIGECYWAQIMNIRKKRQEGRALDENERKFYREHKKDINLPLEITEEEKEWLED